MGAVDLPLGDISGAHLIVDGWRGEVIVEPLQSMCCLNINEHLMMAASLEMDLEQIESGIATTSDGQHVHLMFNAGPFGELSERQRSWIDGVGLYRTEFIFLARSRFPTEDEQESEYRAELATYFPAPVVMRTPILVVIKVFPIFRLKRKTHFWDGAAFVSLSIIRKFFWTQIRAMLRN